jgi:predicted nucleic-acid-binding Zn-ribbon protein
MEELIKKGFRTRATSIYTPGSNKVFKISRSKFSSFIDCPRCFYLDRVKGLKEPSMPGWALNTAVDDLLKKEFDAHRKAGTPHPIMTKHNLNFVPFQHKDMDTWRNSLSGGISYENKDVNLIIHGGVDDVWLNKDTEELVVVDYKAQSSSTPVKTQSYLDSEYHQSYKRQMDIYVHILRKMGFKVSDTTYFLVCNGDRNYEAFDAQMNFTITLVPYKADLSWVSNKIKEMKDVLDSKNAPYANINCEKCIYLESYASIK